MRSRLLMLFARLLPTNFVGCRVVRNLIACAKGEKPGKWYWLDLEACRRGMYFALPPLNSHHKMVTVAQIQEMVDILRGREKTQV